MRTIIVHKAQSLTDRSCETESLTLVAQRPAPAAVPGDPEWATKARAFYDAEGESIADALFTHLPGGTVDAVLRHMLLKRASLLVVPF